MARLEMVDEKKASGEVQELYDVAQGQMGMVPNVLKVMASSPAILRAYIGFSSALAKGKLPAALRERISIATAYFDKCHY